MTERAGYLPGLTDDEVDWQILRFGGADAPLEVAVPVLTDTQMQTMAGGALG